jgi:hypothetical protein
MQRDQLCDPALCPDAPDHGERCDHCPLDRLDAAHSSEPGQLLPRALDLRAALKLGVKLSFDEIAADEFHVMPIVEEEQERFGEQGIASRQG